MPGYLPVEELSDEVWTMVVGWDFFARDVVGKQLCRAADSVGANIAEGGGDGTRLENRRFVRYAKRSLKEVRFLLRRAHARGLTPEDSVKRLKPLVDTLSPKLSAYYRSLAPRPTRLNDSTIQQLNKNLP